MNIIFLTMVPTPSISMRGIYKDLLRHFVSKGHGVYVVYPRERRLGLSTEVYKSDGATYLGVRTLNLQKTNTFEKGVGQVLVERQYQRAIKKYLSGIHFDLILYSTPPISFSKVVTYLKKQSPMSKTYLLLKDIFPQNAVDLGMMKKTGIKGFIYRFFRKKEKQMYAMSDYIGCMSPANVKYLLEHNPDLSSDKVEVAPNSVELISRQVQDDEERHNIRSMYHLPIDKPVFIYGGNLGKPQGVSFLIKCLQANAIREDCYFVVIGTGTEYPKLIEWTNMHSPKNVTVMKGLPKDDYDKLVRSCDVGLIFLDHRFTIPNFPSRLLPYLENKMPVLCATDPNTDMGRIAANNGFGYWCESNSVEDFTAILDKMLVSDRMAMGERGYQFLKENYLTKHTYNAIMSHFK